MSEYRAWWMSCIGCGEEADSELPASVCRSCGDLLEITLSRRMSRRSLFGKEGPGIWRFAEALPLRWDVVPVSLGEGGTPLVRVSRIRAASLLKNLYVKNDGQNPTGSFKDRGMAVAVTRAKALRAKVLVCASTGNTAASLAAYGARAGIRAVVVVPRGGVASGKLGQAFSYGARVFGVEGSFDEALELVFELVRKDSRFYLMNSVNPFRIEGQKVAAFEIYEKLGRVPDYVILPVGNAGNISAIWKGFKELRANAITRSLPRMIGVQAEGAAPIAEAFASGTRVRPWRMPQTVASAIKIGKPVSWKKALAAIRESGGTALTVSDREILAARTELAEEEGLLVEAASATPVAALDKLKLPREANIVCVATGSGLKDIADHKIRGEIERVNDVNAIAAAMGTP